MKTQSYLVKTAVAGVLGLSMVGAANATVVFGDGGVALQDVLDDHTVSSLGSANNDLNESDGGGQFAAGPDLSLSSVNVNTDQFSPDQLWSISGSGGSVSTLIIELAGFANSNSFGIYDAADPTNSVQLFGGSAGLGELVTLSILLNGDVEVTNSGGTSILGNFASNQFGYYLDVAAQNNRWFSEIAGNTDGEDHMVAYQGDGSDILQVGNRAAGIFGSNEYILAWEDLAGPFGGFGGSDRDFTDFVVIVESVNPIPEPGILALLGLGLLGMAGGRRFTKA